MLIIQLLVNTFNLFYSRTFFSNKVLTIKGEKFYIDDASKENKGFIGFFDWLRSDESTIVGIRLCFFEHLQYNKILKKFPFLISSFEGKCSEILFKKTLYNFELSGDQDFANNYIYRNTDESSYLFVFALDHLSITEINSLIQFCSIVNKNDLNVIND